MSGNGASSDEMRLAIRDDVQLGAFAHALRATHACTRTSTHKCIRGGEFCPASKYHKSGWDAKGRRYVCKGSRSHPHWEKP